MSWFLLSETINTCTFLYARDDKYIPPNEKIFPFFFFFLVQGNIQKLCNALHRNFRPSPSDVTLQKINCNKGLPPSCNALHNFWMFPKWFSTTNKSLLQKLEKKKKQKASDILMCVKASIWRDLALNTTRTGKESINYYLLFTPNGINYQNKKKKSFLRLLIFFIIFFQS